MRQTTGQVGAVSWPRDGGLGGGGRGETEEKREGEGGGEGGTALAESVPLSFPKVVWCPLLYKILAQMVLRHYRL